MFNISCSNSAGEMRGTMSEGEGLTGCSGSGGGTVAESAGCEGISAAGWTELESAGGGEEGIESVAPGVQP